ncbi:MAG: hypothetical protein KIT56_04765 [Gammaproteobacteria bacterium]|nr:hypothetical protein [Gammaproteobacteria bacterium]MCW5583189.1 hypothetical protein [Gammaproteobacteria bacterium]
MKSFFKRSAISMIVIGMAGSVCAAPMPNNNATWSSQFSGVFIGVEGLDLRPQNGDLDYVTLFPTSPNGSFNTRNIDTSYDWNWRVFGGIKFTENDDITLSWMQMRTSDSDSVSPASGNNSFARWLVSDGEWSNVWGRATFDLDDAYAVWGHTIYFNNPWSVRFAAGLEYAKLNSKLRVTADSIEDGLSTIGFESKNDTKGIGPRVEFDMTYHLPYGFALFGKVNAALLVSTRDITLNPYVATVESSEEGPTTIDFYTSDYSKRHVVIPKFGMKLGASYSYVFGQAGAEGVPCRRTILTLDAGWQVESYVHAIERPENGFLSVPFGPVTHQPPYYSNGAFASTKTSNFGDQGLFVGIQLGTDWL